MKTLAELKTAIQKHLLELEKLEHNPYILAEKNVLREKAIGRLCYEAEETLSAVDLRQLKKVLQIDGLRWRAYKSRFVHHPPEQD
jgi:hypothetical protein